MRPILRAGSIVVCVVLAAQLLAPVPAAAARSEPYQPPVDAPVVDRFRPPKTRYGPGNRGWEYTTVRGQRVVAAGSGTVVFSGSVGRAQFVVVLHHDGLRTTASFLVTRAVVAGDSVVGGQTIGTADEGFHFTIRSGDDYLDPAAFLEAAAATIDVRLVPASEALPPWYAGAARERRGVVESVVGSLRSVGGHVGAGAGALAGLFVDGVDEVVAGLDSLVVDLRSLGRLVGELAVDELLFWIRMAEEFQDLSHLVTEFATLWRQPCTDDTGGGAVEPPPERRAVVLVDGLSSDSVDSTIGEVDTSALGYDDTDVLRFSYRGGQVPRTDVGSDFAAIEARAYDADDTYGDIVSRGAALADLIEATADAAPDVPVDVFAHSLGGLVTRHALFELDARGRLDVLGQVVTIASPHEGAPLATLSHALGPVSREGLRIGGEAGGFPSPDAEVVQQLARHSPFIRELRDRGVPDSVAFRTIGARGDLIVPGTEAGVDGELHVIVDTIDEFASHSSVTGDSRTTTELALALHALDPQCQGVVDILTDITVGSLVNYSTLASSLIAKRYSR